MKGIVLLIGKLMIIIGIAGFLSVTVQFIVFPKEIPSVISIISGALLIIFGYLTVLFSKKIK